MKFDELRNQPILLFPKPKNEVHFADKDHVWINGRQYISLQRVGEMLKEKHMTNADRIRAMTDEELARWRGSGDCPPNSYRGDWVCATIGCEKCFLDWLKQEVTE